MISSILLLRYCADADNLGITDGGIILISATTSSDIEYMSSYSSPEGQIGMLANFAGAVKQWKFGADISIDLALVKAAGDSEILAKLLAKRGIRTPAEVAAFLDPSNYTPTDPMAFPDMPRAVARINQAIAHKERIVVHGDYDTDGVTSTCVLVTTLQMLGAEVDFYIPHRSEGYGLNLKTISLLASKKRCKLLVTCDCGVSNFAEINFAKSLGVETVIVDHHVMPDLLPPAVAILHPEQFPEDHALRNLSGVGVAYKLAEALLINHERGDEVPKLLDLVTLGLIADMVPLTKENRYLVQIGLPALLASERAGIKALLGNIEAREGSDLVGFGLAPRINAVGRLSDASIAVDLLCTNDTDRATELAGQLERENEKRQELCETIFAAADLRAGELIRSGQKALALYDAEWHHGVVGIVASRLVDKYACPVFIGQLDTAEGTVKGSCRSIPSVDLYQVLKANEHLAQKWGGHKMAAGFTVEADKADVYCRALVDTCHRMLISEELAPTIEIDLELDAADVTLELAGVLRKLGPYGMGNRKPIFSLTGLKSAGGKSMGKEGKHSRIMLKDAARSTTFECVYWNSRGNIPADGLTVDAIFTPEINSFNGVDRLQLVLSDWRDPAAPPVVAPISAVASAAPITAPATAPAASTMATAAKPAAAVVAVSPSATTSAPTKTMSTTAPAPGGKARNIEGHGPTLVFKDLRQHADPNKLLEAATGKLGDQVGIFAESCPAVSGIDFVDRTGVAGKGHLILWQFPPSLQVLRSLVADSGAKTLYLIGKAPAGTTSGNDEATAFIKRLTGIVRYAINHRDGVVEAEKLAAAMSSSKMCVALGLRILKKVNLIDWFAEEGYVHLDVLGDPACDPEDLPEFRQLIGSLSEVVEFRKWCAAATLEDIQLALAPNSDQGSVEEEHAASADGLTDDADGDDSEGEYESEG